MTSFRADLHIHSLFSDGTDTPQEILEKGKAKGLSGLSITDHDTTKGYTPALFSKAKELGIELLPGVEISSEWNFETIHILGYGFCIDSLGGFLEAMQEKRGQRNRKILERLASFGILIREEDLLSRSKQSPGRPHIAQILIEKGCVNSLQEAFEIYLKEGAKAYVAGFQITPREVIEEIKKAKGKAVLAHPHFFKNQHTIDSLLSLPFDGIECYYGNLFPHIEAKWLRIARKKNWIATGGSDYHGSIKPHIELGRSWVGEETFRKLFA